MPQPGLHAIVALAFRNRISKRRGFALGLVFGSLTPDLDGYAQAWGLIVQKMPPEIAEAVYHRTLTHSLLTATAACLFMVALSYLVRKSSWRTFALGFFVGVVLFHIAFDLLAWFDGVSILWPFGSVDLWSSFALPELVSRLLRAANFLAFAAYFAYLLALAKRAESERSFWGKLGRAAIAQCCLGLLLVCFAFLLPSRAYDLLDGAILLLYAYPTALWVTWRMRATIEAEALPDPGSRLDDVPMP